VTRSPKAYVYGITAVAAVCGLLFGFDTAVIIITAHSSSCGSNSGYRMVRRKWRRAAS
jgi:hypothetical protein